jgi:hypothetical protein
MPKVKLKIPPNEKIYAHPVSEILSAVVLSSL